MLYRKKMLGGYILFMLGFFYVVCYGQSRPPRFERWSEPKAVFVDSTRMLANIVPFEQSVGKEGHSSLTLIGNTVPEPWDVQSFKSRYKQHYHSEYNISKTLAGITHQGKKMRIPPGDFTFMYPKGTMDGSGTFHLVWAEPGADSVSVHKGPPTIKKLYYADYKNGVWSEPQLIYEAKGIQFEYIVSSKLWAKEDGDLDVAFFALKGKRGKVLIYLKRENNVWHAKELYKNSIVGSYTDMVHITRNKLLMVWVGADLEIPGDQQNDVFIMRSKNHGQTWTKPKRIFPTGNSQAFEPRLIVSPKGTVQLLFEMISHIGGVGKIWHLSSSDDGRNWITRAKIILPGISLDGLRAIMDTHGGIHMVCSTRNKQYLHRQLYYLYWDKHSWSKPLQIASSVATPRTLYESSNNDIYIFYTYFNLKNKYAIPRPMYRVKKFRR